MKIIQSFWSKPFEQSYKGDKDNRPDGGWLNQSFYFMSWAYSFWKLSAHYSQIELVTDKKGKEILVDILGLPYSRVYTVLDNINHYPHELWALGKIYAYGMQQETFLHVDGDLFIWQPFPKAIEDAPLFSQHREFGYQFYQDLFATVKQELTEVPESIINYHKKYRQVNAYNMGVAGGTDAAFFRRFAVTAFDFINSNLDRMTSISAGLFNTFYEQVLFCSLAHADNLPVNTLLDSDDECITVWQAQGLDRFIAAPKRTSFIHLYGYCKRNPDYCFVLKQKLKKDYPDAYERVVMAFEERLIVQSC